ncbi:MAG: AroM family protein [Thermoplasmatales archaeon]
MRVGFLTIGQSPRRDILQDIEPILQRQKIEFIECGALDNLSKSQIYSLQPESNEDYILVTRLLDGTEVKVSRSKIVKRMQECISRLENQVEVFGLFCTGEFPELRSKKLLIEPSILLKKVVEAVSINTSLTVLIPSADQEKEIREKWKGNEEITVIPISPYTSTPQDFKDKLKGVKAGQLVIMDCFGYSLEMKRITMDLLKRPVIFPRTLLASIISEISY